MPAATMSGVYMTVFSPPISTSCFEVFLKERRISSLPDFPASSCGSYSFPSSR